MYASPAFSRSRLQQVGVKLTLVAMVIISGLLYFGVGSLGASKPVDDHKSSAVDVSAGSPSRRADAIAGLDPGTAVVVTLDDGTRTRVAVDSFSFSKGPLTTGPATSGYYLIADVSVSCLAAGSAHPTGCAYSPHDFSEAFETAGTFYGDDRATKAPALGSGNLAAGASRRGYVVVQVPAGPGALIYQYAGSGDLDGSWDLPAALRRQLPLSGAGVVPTP